MRISYKVLCFFLLFSPLHLFAQNRDIAYMSAGGKLRPLQAIMDIRHYTLALDVNISSQSIAGFADIDIVLSRPTDTLLLDLWHLYDVSSITVDKSKAVFNKKGDSLLIIDKTDFKAGRHAIRVNYSGVPPVAVKPPWTGGFTWSKDKSGNPWVSINCQTEGAKVYFPCKDHPSDEPDEGVDLFITVPRGLTVAGPGLLKGVKKIPNDKATWHWKTNYTISNYCVVFSIAKYKVLSRPYTTIDSRTVLVQFYVLEEDTANAGKVLETHIRDARILEKYFGEYPWVKEKMGIAEVPNPGMEHQTMITYGDKFTYDKYPGFDYSENLFHELAHEWWANKVTNQDWSHLWIQEGMATYAEALFFREKLGESGYDSVMLSQRSAIRNQMAVVKGEGLSLAEADNNDAYNKGSFLMHTLRHVMGDSLFFPALKKFVTDIKYPYNQFFTTADIQAYFCKASGLDLNPLFDFYLRSTKTMDFELFKLAPDTYYFFIRNSPIELPVDILTDKGIMHVKVLANKMEPLKIVSKIQPVIDPNGYYLKKVIIQ